MNHEGAKDTKEEKKKKKKKKRINFLLVMAWELKI
jgi:hypothetical protein